MVRTCNGLELRDPAIFVDPSASEFVESSVLFPSIDSRDELNPRFLICLLFIIMISYRRRSYHQPAIQIPDMNEISVDVSVIYLTIPLLSLPHLFSDPDEDQERDEKDR